MNHITSILSVMRAFTPKGQELALNILKRNRATLSEEFGFAYLPKLIAGEGKTKLLENELLDKSMSIRDIVIKQLERLRCCSASEEIKQMQNQLHGISFFNRTKINTECISALSNDFNTKKQNLLNLIQTKYLDALDIDGNKLIFALQNADSPEKLKWVVEDLLKHINDHHSNNVKKVYVQLGRQQKFKKFISTAEADEIQLKPNNEKQMKIYKKQVKKLEKNFEIQRAKYNSTCAYNDDLFELLKLLTSPSCDKRVIEIEEMLKQKYGLQYVSLYDYANAKKVEEGLKILSSQTKLPQNILVTPHHFQSTQTGRHLMHADGTQTILLNPIEFDLINIAKGISKDSEKSVRKSFIADTCIKEINDSSTNHPAHTVVHEVLHGENNWFTSTRIPERFSDTVNKLSIYAKESAQSGKTKETLTELRAEEVINGSLSKDKKSLLEYLK